MKLVLIGPHGAGKTTLGRALSAALGWPFHEEIGRQLAADPAYRPPGVGVADAQPRFDLSVLTAEIARDLEHAASGGGPRIIETWHPGNVVYARRSPAIAAAGLTHLRTLDWSDVVLVPVVAPDEVLRARRSEPGTGEYFIDVATATWALSAALTSTQLSVVWTHEEPAELLASRVATELQKLLGVASQSEPRIPTA